MASASRLAAAAYWLLYAGAVLGALAGAPHLTAAAAAALAVFLILEAPRAPVSQGLLAGGLAALGLALGAAAGEGWLALRQGLERTLPLMVLFAAVAFLNRPALASPAFRRVGEAMVRQPPGRRFLMVSLAGSLIGAVLNLAGLYLVLNLLGRQPEPRLERRLSMAAMRGFSAAAAWSPFFVAMAVVLVTLPGLGWPQVAPGGLAVAAVLIAVAYGLDRLTRGPRPAATAPPPRLPRPELAATLLVFALLAVPVLALAERADLSIPFAIGVVAPLVALGWQARLAGRRRAVAAAGHLLREHARRLPSLRGEGLVFTGANLLGAGVAAYLNPDAVAAALAALAPAPEAALALLLAALTLLGAVGVHPVVLVVVAGQVLPPAALGVPAWLMGATLLAGWCLGTAASPFSGTVMQVSRFLRRSPWQVAWRWNLPYVAAAYVPVAALLALMGRMA